VYDGELTDTETKTTSADWTVTVQSSYTATATSSVSITGSFDDHHGLPGGSNGPILPYRPRVRVYRDTIFGSFLFEDADAPAAAVALPPVACIVGVNCPTGG
jgi:hypothetical protein